MKYAMFNPLILVTGLLLLACSAVVPLASSDMDAEAKLFKKIPDKANIYIVHTVPYVQRLHDVSIDGGVRISLAARNYTVFSVPPGLHTIVVYSTENRELLKLEARAGSLYFIDMGWKMGSGTGDLKATVGLMSEVEGKEKIQSMHLVSADGY